MRKAVYAGTFDPITNGHLDIATRAADIFDTVIIAVAEDNYKHPLFDIEERCRLIREATAPFPGIEVQPFSGLLVDFCHANKVGSIIRGLRAVSDFDRELQMALFNRNLAHDIDTVFLMSEAKYLFISSSMIRNSASLGANISDLVPSVVARALEQKYSLPASNKHE